MFAKVLGNNQYKITTVKGLRGYKNFDATIAIDSLRHYHNTVPGNEHCDDGYGDNEEAAIDRQDLIDLLEE